MKDLFSVCRAVGQAALATDAVCDVHLDDYLFQFLLEHPSFDIDTAATYYFEDGRRSARKLAALLADLGQPHDRPFSLLEFASGYGCVTRHLRDALPGADVTSCDIHANAVEFVRARLRHNALLSSTQPEALTLPRRYDVIFALSFYSHMPRETWGRWLRAHVDALSDGGMLIFTTHGLHSRTFLGDPIVPVDGFWFEAKSEQKDLNPAEYGLTIVTRAFVEDEVRRQTGRPLHLFKEAFWWEHQDLYVVTRP